MNTRRLSEHEIASLYRRIAEARADQGRWRLLLDTHPDVSNHQRGVWCGELRRARHRERTCLERLGLRQGIGERP